MNYPPPTASNAEILRWADSTSPGRRRQTTSLTQAAGTVPETQAPTSFAAPEATPAAPIATPSITRVGGRDPRQLAWEAAAIRPTSASPAPPVTSPTVASPAPSSDIVGSAARIQGRDPGTTLTSAVSPLNYSTRGFLSQAEENSYNDMKKAMTVTGLRQAQAPVQALGESAPISFSQVAADNVGKDAAARQDSVDALQRARDMNAQVVNSNYGRNL